MILSLLYNYIIVKKTYICYISFNKIIKVVKMIYNNINKKFVSEDVKKYFKIDKLMFSLVVNLFFIIYKILMNIREYR